MINRLIHYLQNNQRIMIDNLCHSFGILIMSLFVFACSADDTEQTFARVVNLQRLKEASIDKNDMSTGVRVLKTYVNEDSCMLDTHNADLYICRNIENNDTVYVFNICEEVASFALVESVENFVILHDDIRKDADKSVVVKIPSDIVIPKGAKYLLANLTRLID